MSLALFLALGLALAGPSAAAQPATPTPLVQPAGALVLAAPAQAPGPARFAGRVQVHGVLVAQWAGPADAREPRYSVLLAPESARVLPHWQGAPVSAVQLTAQGPATLVALTSPALAAAFLRDRHATLSAEALFTLHDLAVGGPCGLAWAEAAVSDADPVRLLRSSGPVSLPTCRQP